MPHSFKSTLLALSLGLMLTPAWSVATRLEQAVQDQGLQTDSAWLLLRAQVAQGQTDAAFATIAKLTQRQQWLPADQLEGEPALAAMRSDAAWRGRAPIHPA